MRKVFALLLCIMLAAGAAPPVRATGPHTQTIMVYIVGSDLESEGSFATQDIAEMLPRSITRSA